jgi:hypothetical protein
MRETKIRQPLSSREDYRRPGGRAAADKVSPLRGLKQRWAVGKSEYAFLYRTRREAMRFFDMMPIEMQEHVGRPHRVFV